jgi:phosphohistidine phosphatase
VTTPPNPPGRRLVLMRHAKAEQVAASDHERALTPRGVQDALDAGRWAAGAHLLPEHVVVSSAARTRATWDAFAEASGATAEPVVDRSLYAAGTDGALELLRCVPADARTVMLVGHNPTVAHLVHLLDDGGAEPAVFSAVSTDYPTAALTVLEVPCAWGSIDVGSARIVGFHVGRGG